MARAVARAVWPLLATALAVSSCSLVVDSRVEQCALDEECPATLPVCDPGTRVCVASPSSPVAPDRSGGRDAPVMAIDDAAGEAATPPPSGTDAGLPDEAGTAADASAEAGDSPAAATDCDRPGKPLVRIEGEITANDTLGCDRDYLLIGPVLVRPGVALTIAPGTVVMGDGPSKGTLIVQPGARLIADGRRDAPIVFTSARPLAERRPGDWGGLILLGRAPTNAQTPVIEGIVQGGEYGGTDEDDSSGVLRFVRIEYSGIRLGPNNEINGLTLGGVGRKTIVDHVQVRQTTDDCFEFFGGTVDARHLICQGNGDDGFDFDNGYRGRLQFLLLQQDPAVMDETNGIEGDNDALGTVRAPISEPTIYNVTMCGRPRDLDREQYAILLRRSARAHIFNTVAVGFEAGLDLRDARTQLELESTLLWGNHARPVAYEEDGSNLTNQQDDDEGLDEQGWFSEASRRNDVQDPMIGDCFDRASLELRPRSPITHNARRPPDDGFFDTRAAFLGAFRDRNDGWAAGRWVVWQER